MPFTLGILYFLQIPIYFKFHIEVHLRKLQFWKKTKEKYKKLFVNFLLYFYYFNPLQICSHLFLCSMNAKDVFST